MAKTLWLVVRVPAVAALRCMRRSHSSCADHSVFAPHHSISAAPSPPTTAQQPRTYLFDDPDGLFADVPAVPSLEGAPHITPLPPPRSPRRAEPPAHARAGSALDEDAAASFALDRQLNEFGDMVLNVG